MVAAGLRAGRASGSEGASLGTEPASAEERGADRRVGAERSDDPASFAVRASTAAVYSFARALDGKAPSGSGRIADASYRNSDPQFGRAGQEFDPNDLAVLADIIALNELTEDSSTMDFDNGDGVLDPTELGNQIWCGSRLRVLQMGPNSFSSFGYKISKLPDSISQLRFLRVLESNETGLEALPASLGTMQELERVSAFGNRLTELPPELATAGRLEEIQVGGNEVSKIPAELAEKPELKRLFVSGNPIEEMPLMLAKQNEKVMRGQLVVPSRDIGPFRPDCRPAS